MDEKYKRQEFSQKTKDLARERSGGLCEECGCIPKQIEYDHIVDCFFEGTNELSNCQVLCSACHRAKTKATPFAKSRRLIAKREGKAQRQKRKIPSRPMAGTKKSGWKKPLHGPAQRRVLNEDC